MTVGIVGLGLIGASLAAAFKSAGLTVLGVDKDKSIQDFAKMAGNIGEPLTEDNLSRCDGIFLAIKPTNAIDWLDANKENIKRETIVIDCCGTKRSICSKAFEIADRQGFTFVGGHPMAGKQKGGFKNSSADLFEGAMFAIVPKDKNDIKLISRVKGLLQQVGFEEFSVMTPEEHDQIIAFTSQLAHLISNAYIKSDMADVGAGAALSGGAFRDMTRVAYLDENMWTELFLDNKDNLIKELDSFVEELERYKEAICAEDVDELSRLLMEGKNRKKEIEESGN